MCQYTCRVCLLNLSCPDQPTIRVRYSTVVHTGCMTILLVSLSVCLTEGERASGYQKILNILHLMNYMYMYAVNQIFCPHQCFLAISNRIPSKTYTCMNIERRSVSACVSVWVCVCERVVWSKDPCMGGLNKRNRNWKYPPSNRNCYTPSIAWPPMDKCGHVTSSHNMAMHSKRESNYM